MKKECNGGFIDTIDAINKCLSEKYHRTDKVFGFERSKKGDKNLRFFDREEKTIWLPDELYDQYNKYLIKIGALEKGKFVTKDRDCSFSDFVKKLRDRIR